MGVHLNYGLSLEYNSAILESSSSSGNASMILEDLSNVCKKLLKKIDSLRFLPILYKLNTCWYKRRVGFLTIASPCSRASMLPRVLLF